MSTSTKIQSMWFTIWIHNINRATANGDNKETHPEDGELDVVALQLKTLSLKETNYF